MFIADGWFIYSNICIQQPRMAWGNVLKRGYFMFIPKKGEVL